MDLIDLPVEILDKILSYLTYDEIAKVRAVNRLFNALCSDKLNKGFVHVNQFHNRCLKAVKTKLPRRESERKSHPLARHCDILMALETRLSMLSMTFSKYIEAGQCCFIPGKVLDEALKVLRIVKGCLTPLECNGQFPMLPRPHEFLQEYRDVSSMAMEHFDDKILPGITEKMRLPSVLRTNHRLYCYSKPAACPVSLLAVRHPVKGVKSFRQIAGPSTSTANVNIPRLPSDVTDLVEVRAEPVLKGYRGMLKAVNHSVKNMQMLFRVVTRKFKRQNTVLRNQLVKQRVMIKHLRREVRETRAAVNAMSKDLNQLKLERSYPRGMKRKRESCDEDCI